MQMRHDQFRRRVSQPFREGKVLKAIGLEHLQEHQIGVACILDVVQQALLHVSDISLLKVHCPSFVACSHHRHSSLPTDKILPLVCVRVPMQFP